MGIFVVVVGCVLEREREGGGVDRFFFLSIVFSADLFWRVLPRGALCHRFLSFFVLSFFSPLVFLFFFFGNNQTLFFRRARFCLAVLFFSTQDDTTVVGLEPYSL